MPKKSQDNSKTTAKNTGNVVAEATDPTLVKVMQRFNASREYTRKGFWDTWKNARKLYNSQRVNVNYDGNSDTFVPETYSIIQSIRSNIIGGHIAIDYLPTSEDQSGDIKTLKSLMDQVWIQDNTKLKASLALDDSLQVGNGYLWQYWNGSFPCNVYIPTEDNFFDPDATLYENLRYGGYRYVTTLEELKKETIANENYDSTNPKSTIRVPRYKNLDKVNTYAVSGVKNNLFGGDKTAKQLREEMVAGSVLSSGKDNENLVEVIVYHDHEKIVRIANRCTVIEERDTPFARKATTIDSVDNAGNKVVVPLPEIKPFIPVAPARDVIDGAMWYAKGEIEVLQDLQELLNDTQNQKTDNLNFSLNRMWTLDPSLAHKIDEIQSVPGAVFTVPAGSLEPVANANIGVDADNEIYRIESTMRRATAADEIMQGVAPRGSATATEINAQVIQAGNRFSTKLEMYESEFFKILANNMLKIMQIFLTQEQAVRLIGQDGIEWKTYNPGEYLGDYDVNVQLESTARKVREEEKQSGMQFFLLASKMPFVNQEALFKMTARKLFDLDDRDLQGLIQPPMPMLPPSVPGTQPPQPGMGGVQGMPQQGAGVNASAPMSQAEMLATNSAMQSQGMNIPGMPQS